MIGHNFEIKMDDNFDTCIYIDGKEIHFIKSFELVQDCVQEFDTPTLKLSLLVVDPITISATGNIVINDIEVEDDIGLQIYELLKEKYKTEESK
jgi:hypothetical protein